MSIRIVAEGSSWLVYLYHFRNGNYGYERQGKFVTPKHYCGVTNDLANRDKTHRSGNGSRFINAVHTEQRKAGKVVTVVECPTKKSAYLLERALKKSKNLKRFCPCCNPKARDALNHHLGILNIDIPF